ncbi:DNRLRE domain-containing protein [Desulfosporosinus nitroreducens]|uniref:DNRLRE domain-containing protein n=1 Tax=Desulfosporosinus nitroreducens TaxID=2018668 RepID=UPI00207CA3AD|nr:DNRLRE domain-containing protein [Desulfosporosinus nitroreducens]MCO1604046.1 DNRLRE domain-containing protein [Desulfosporosinus nitroreducens]
MPKKFWQKAMGLALAVSLILNGILANVAMAKTLTDPVHGKYYGQTLPISKKIKEISSDSAKTQKPLRTPSVQKSSQPYQGRFHQEQEKPDKRTVNSKTFSAGNGHNNTFVFLEKIHYKEANGSYQDIDNTLVIEKTDKPGRNSDTENAGDKTYINKANDYKVSFPESLTKDKPISITKDKARLELIPVEGDFSRSAVKENAILYNDVFPGIDYSYTVLNTNVKEDIILNNQTDRTQFSFAVKTEGIELKQEKGAIFGYEQGSSSPTWTIPAPYMVDASGKVSKKVELHLEKNILQKDRIILTVDKDWLTAPERAYPVRIDPTVTINSSDIADTSVEQGSPDVYTDNAYSYIGYDDGKISGNLAEYGEAHLMTRTFLKFTKPDLGPDQSVSSASLNMYKFTSWSEAPRKVELQRVNESFGIAGLTWNTQPQETSFVSSATIDGSTGYVQWDMTNLMNDMNAGATNHGIMLMYNNELEQAEVFASVDNKDHPTPYIEITHEDKGSIDPGETPADPSIKLRPYVAVNNNGLRQFVGLTADGLAVPKSTIKYSAVPDNGEGFSGSVSAAVSYRYPNFHPEEMFSDLLKDGGSFNQYTAKESNWQTNKLFVPKMDTLYHIEAKAFDEEGDLIGTSVSESFQIYQVKTFDLLSRIAGFYDVTIDQLKLDNNIGKDGLIENNVIFIRNPQQNQGKAMTPTDLTDEQKKLFDASMIGRAKNCVFDFEPINMLTGNFYYNAEDLSIPDFGGKFTIARAYNAKTGVHRGPFGNRWDSNFNQYLAFMADNSVAYIRSDGSIINFQKNPDGSYTAPVGENYTLEKQTEDYKLTLKDQSIYYFALDGLLKAIEDKNCNRTRLNYDLNERLTSIVSPAGKVFSVMTDAQARITSIGLPNGGSLDYTYDEDGNLATYTDAGGRETTYNYDSQGRMVSYLDPNGNRVIQNTYDEQSRVVTQIDANGGQASIAYYDGYNESTDANGNKTTYYFDDQYRITKTVKPDGNTEEYTYDAENNRSSFKDVLDRVMTYAYDSQGNKTKETRWDGLSQTFTYDNKNNLLTSTDYNGHTASNAYDNKGSLIQASLPDGSSTEYTYNSQGLMLTIKDPEGNLTSYEYEGADPTQVKDPLNHDYRYYYNPLGLPVTVIDPEGKLTRLAYDPAGRLLNTQLPDQSITRYTYDPNGNNTAITDGRQNTVHFSYDPMDHLAAVQDPLGNSTAYTYDPNGNKTEEKDPSDYRIKYTYDSLNRLTKTQDQDNGLTVYERDALGQILSVTDPKGNKTSITYNTSVDKPAQTVTALGQTTTYQYDPVGNLLRVVFPDSTKKQYRYDELNRPNEITDITGVKTTLTYDNLSHISQIQDSLGREYHYRYDPNGNLLQTTDPLDYEVKYSYNDANLPITRTNEEGKTTSYSYNSINKLKETVDPNGHTKTLAYDLAGNLTAVTDARGNKTTLTYDPLNRLQAVKDPLEGIIQYRYNPAGRLDQKLDPLGHATSYEYNGRGLAVKVTDALGGITELQYDQNGNTIALIDAEGGSYSYAFDSVNRLINAQDPLGLKSEYTYDLMNRKIKSEDNGGNIYNFIYDPFGRLQEQTDILDRSTQYSYDLAGNITSVTTPDGNTVNYKYDLKGQISKLTDPEGKITNLTYDGLGHLKTKLEPGSRLFSYVYDSVGNLTEEQNPIEAKTQYFYDENNNLIETKNAKENSKNYEYDPLNRLQAVLDERGNKTTFNYDPNGNLVKKTDPVGNSTQYAYDPLNRSSLTVDALGFDSAYQYDKLGNLIGFTDARGNKTSYTYNKHRMPTQVTDALQGESQYRYDLNDNLLGQIDALGAETRYTYDPIHRLTSVTDPEGYIRFFSYDKAGNQDKQYDSAGNILTYSYDKMHRLLGTKNTAGHLTSYSYDPLGNLETVKQPNGNTTAYDYDILNRLTQITDPEEKITKIDYDILDNIENVVIPGNRHYSYDYDETNNRIQDTNPLGESNTYTYNPNNLTETITNPLGNTTTYSYNPLNQLNKVKQPLGNTTRFDYDPNLNLAAQTDGNDHTTSYSYDPLNRLSAVTNPLGNTTAYDYDAVGNLTSATDGNGHTSTSTYNQRHETLSRTNPLGEKESYEYNPVGTLSSATKADGTEISYSYDILNRLSEKLYKQADSNGETIQDAAPAEVEASTDSQTNSSEEPNSAKLINIFTRSSHPAKTSPTKTSLAKKSTDVNTAPTDSAPADPTTAESAQSQDSEDVSYNYDIMGSRTVMDGPEGETDYSYDKIERLTSVSLPTAEEVTYVYDQLGRKSKLIYPDGKYVKYTYDALDRITSATDWEGQKTLYSYDANGRRIETVLPNGAKVSYSYDENDQLIKLENKGSDDSIISSFEYGYDQAGNITQEIQTQTGSVYTRTYTYDAADEVIGFTEQSDQELKTYSYTYDKTGNRLTEDITGKDDTKHLTYDYNEGDELILKSHDGDRDRFDYDKNGNVIRSTTQGNQVTSYDYDSENRLVQITEQQGKIQTFGYDSDGNRLYKTVGVYWQAPTEPGPIQTEPGQGNGKGNGNGNGKDKDKGNNGNPGQGNGQNKKLSDVQSNTSVVAVYRMLAAGGNGKGGGNSGGNSGGGNSGSKSNSGGGNSGGNGNSGSKSNGQDKSIHDNGKDQEKGNDSGKHVGWDKKKLKKVKGNKGKHLGWYKRADHPMNPIDQAPINKPDAYEVINYINDVSLKNTQTLMTTDKEGVYRGVYTYGNERIAERDLVAVEGVPNDPLYYLYDGHNSVTQMINSAGHVRDKYRYDPFGAPMPGGKLSPNTRLFNNPYGYNGEAHDIDSGLQFLRARYYDPSMGRFQTRDSYLGEIISPLSLNRYVYTANNPVMYSDPSGHIPNPDTFQAYSYKPTLAEQFLQYSPMNARPEPTVNKPITEVIRSLKNPQVVPENILVGPTISNSVNNSVRVTDSKSYADHTSAKKPNYNKVLCDGEDISSQGTSNADYLVSSGKQLILGNYTNDVTALGTAGQIGTGLLGVDLPGDIRDISYDVKNWEWSWSHVGKTTLDTAGVLPLVGALKYTDKAAALLKGGAGNANLLQGRNGALNQAKRDAGILRSQHPDAVESVPMKSAPHEGGHVIKDANGNVIYTREYYYTNQDGKNIIIQEHSAGHPKGGQGPHFNVRPIENPRTGSVPGTNAHYPFNK